MDTNFMMQSSIKTNDRIWCFVEDNNIYQTDMTGARRQVGYTLNAYEDLQETTSQYYEKLVELGEIVPEKTTDEVLKETQNTMLEMAQIMKSLQAEIKDLKSMKGVNTYESKRNSEPSVNNVPATTHSKGDRTSTAKDTGSK